MRVIASLAPLVWLTVSALAQAQAPAAEHGQPQPARQVTVTAIPDVVAAGATWKLVWQGTNNADGLAATADGGILFAQEQPRRVSKIDANDGVTVFVENTRGAGSLAVDARGRILAAQRTCTDPGLNGAPCSEPTAIGIEHPVSDRRMLANTYQGKSFGRPNDLVVGAKGGVYFTSGGAYFINPAGEVSSVGENLRTNGIMLSPDERTLYVTNGPVVVPFD